MATALKTSSSIDDSTRGRMFGRIKIGALVFLLLVLVASAAFSWMTRDAMAHLQFLRGHAGNGGSKKTLVDLSAWQTAQALAPLAVSAEEMEYAHDAERLADHEADQAFAVALRQAARQTQNRVLTGDALALSQKVEQLQQLVTQDQAQVASLTAKTKTPGKEGAAGEAKAGAGQDNGDQDDLEMAKAQLGLDLDELADAKLDLERASGDNSSQIQGELAAHEAAMRKVDSSAAGDGQVAVLSAKRNSTLALRVKAWFSQNSRMQLIEQALQQTQADVAALTAEHNALESKAEEREATGGSPVVSHAAALANIKDKSAVRQILSIYDDRIQTEKQLATVYGKWSAQVQLQHRIVLHLMLQSVMVIAVVGLGMILGSALVRRLIRPGIDRREAQTLRSILELSVQVVGAGIILVVIFGSPEQVPTILGFATAAVTIALQDFIVAFLGWFVLVGKNGIHVGDAVEINGTTGEVTEVGLFSTTLLETGDSTGKGQFTGRRITFVNSFAIRGKYFNFSTSGQWTWDEIVVNIPATADMHDLTERIHALVTAETAENARLAEQDWKRGRKDLVGVHFGAEAVLSLRPTATGIDVEARYVTRASERFEVRNRLNQKLIELLHQRTGETAAEAKLAVEGEGGAAH